MPDKKTILAKMSRFLRLPAERLDADAALTSLVAESFVLVEMAIELQEEFDVQFGQQELKEVKTVGDLVGLIERLSNA